MRPTSFHSPDREYSLSPCRRIVPFQRNWWVTGHAGSITAPQRNWAVNCRDGVWWHTEKPSRRAVSLKDIVEDNATFDKDDVLRLVPERHWSKLRAHDTVYATGYRRTRNGTQQLELRFDGIAGCLRTPEGGSSKQYLVVKKNGQIHARLLTVREAARLMGAPDSFELPGSYNDGYKAMGGRSGRAGRAVYRGAIPNQNCGGGI